MVFPRTPQKPEAELGTLHSQGSIHDTILIPRECQPKRWLGRVSSSIFHNETVPSVFPPETPCQGFSTLRVPDTSGSGWQWGRQSGRQSFLLFSFGLKLRKGCRMCGNRISSSDCSHYFPSFIVPPFKPRLRSLLLSRTPWHWPGVMRLGRDRAHKSIQRKCDEWQWQGWVGGNLWMIWWIEKRLRALPRSSAKRIWAVPVACSRQEPCWEHRRNTPYLINTPSFSTSSLQNKYTAPAINHIIINNALRMCGGGEFGTNPAFEWCSWKMKSSA